MTRQLPVAPDGYLRRVGIVVFPGFDFQAFSLLQDIFTIASQVTGISPIALSLDGGIIQSAATGTVATHPITADQIDTMIVVGAELGKPVPCMRELADFLCAATAIVDRTVAIGSGVEVLAESSILNGKRAVVRSELAQSFSVHYPEVRIVRCREFISDKGIWTSTGTLSIIPLCMALIGETWGSRARDAVISHVSENAAWAAPIGPNDEDVDSERSDGPLKLMTARHHVQFGTNSFEQIARSTGFSNAENMRRGFLKRYGVPPQVLRRAEKLGRKVQDRAQVLPRFQRP